MTLNRDLISLIVETITSLDDEDYTVVSNIRGIKYERRLNLDERISLWTLGQVNREFRQIVQATLWFEVTMIDLQEIDDVLDLLQITPHVTQYIRFLCFRLRWSSRMYLVDRKDKDPTWFKNKWCPDFLDWVYADREQITREYESIRSEELGSPFILSSIRPSSGPLGGQDLRPVSQRHRDAAASMKAIEELITQMPSLIGFHYRSMLLPLTQRSCEYLRDCKSLEMISLGTQGEMDTLKYPATPLEVIFTKRRKPLKVVSLSLQLSPSEINAVQDCDLEAFEGQLRHSSVLDKVEEELVDTAIPFLGQDASWASDPKPVIMPELDHYLASTSMDGIPFIDRPMVAVIRSLIAAQDSIGLLVLSSTCRWLCRMPQIVWLWLKVRVSNRYPQGADWWTDEPWVQAARALRPACESLVRRLGRPNSRLLPEDVLLVADVSKELEIYRPFLRDGALQRKISDTWNLVVRTGHRWKGRDLLPLETEDIMPLRFVRPDLRADLTVCAYAPVNAGKIQYAHGP